MTSLYSSVEVRNTLCHWVYTFRQLWAFIRTHTVTGLFSTHHFCRHRLQGINTNPLTVHCNSRALRTSIRLTLQGTTTFRLRTHFPRHRTTWRYGGFSTLSSELLCSQFSFTRTSLTQTWTSHF